MQCFPLLLILPHFLISPFPRFLVSSFPRFLVSRFSFPISRFPFPVSRFPFPVSRFLFPVSRFTTFDPIPDPVPVCICHSDLPVHCSDSDFRSGSRSGSRFRLPFWFPSPSSFPLLAAALHAASRFAPALRCFIKKAALDQRQSLG